MPAIDKLLGVLAKNQMNVLDLEPSHAPCLRKGPRRWAVSKSTLSAAEIQRLMAQIVPAGEQFPPPGSLSSTEFEYELDGLVFEIRGERRPEGWAAAISVNNPAEVEQDQADAEALLAKVTAPAVEIRSIDLLLAIVAERGASDLHLSSGEVPRIRVDGELEELHEFKAPSAEKMKQLLDSITPEENRKQFEEVHEADFGYQIDEMSRYRVNLFMDRHGMGGVFRHIPTKIPSADAIGLSEEVRQLALLNKGLVVVTGPTGSGKSTTLATLVDIVNRTRHDHIVTIEDPIEFTHKSRRCLVNQREVGVHTKSFANALRAALREDPDVVLVGEMRDLETIEIALRTAETGHLVYGTLHTTTAISTINRIIDQFPADQQEQIRLMLADTLSAVIAQVLLPRIGGGRVAAREVLLITPAVANLIRTAKTFQIASVMQTHKSQGMMTLNDSLMELVENKIVDPKEAYLKAVEKRALIGRMRAAGISTQFLDTVTDTDAEEFEGTGSRKRPAEAQESGPQPPGRRRDGEQQRDEAVPPRAAAGAGR